MRELALVSGYQLSVGGGLCGPIRLRRHIASGRRRVVRIIPRRRRIAGRGTCAVAQTGEERSRRFRTGIDQSDRPGRLHDSVQSRIVESRSRPRGGIATGNGKRQRHRFGHRFLTPRVRALNPPNAQPDAEQDDCGGGITAPRTEQRDTLGRMRIRMQLHAALHLRPRRNGQSRLRVVQLAPQCFIQRIPFHLRSPPLLSVF